ncbi:hypothetical protein QQF64_015800 [Cirrhinus molitorella]|uniref:Secreted protein n=1 Tax=Cirrhinus molitorella TaxID=172907 RepID=A0ABR3LNJ0_9TELE
MKLFVQLNISLIVSFTSSQHLHTRSTQTRASQDGRLAGSGLAADPHLTKHGQNSQTQRRPLGPNAANQTRVRKTGESPAARGLIIASAGPSRCSSARFRPGNDLHNSLPLSLTKYVPIRNGKLRILSSEGLQIRRERTKREYFPEPQK